MRLIPACLILSVPARAQNQDIDDLKGKIFDARMAKQTFANGLKFCSELDGKHFYFLARDRVVALEDYHRSLENLARQQVFNPQTHKPWTEQDAAERWDFVQKQAAKDQANCQLVASLPALEKQLDDMEKNRRRRREEKLTRPCSLRAHAATVETCRCCGRAFSAKRKRAVSCRRQGNDQMPSLSDWKVPAAAQPKPEDYGYDLERAFNAVVGLRAIIPGDAYHRRDARHRARRQRRVHPRQRPGADHRLPDHRSRDDLAQSQRRPLGARPRAWATTRRPASASCRRSPSSTCRRCEIGQSAAASIGERVVVAGAGGRQRSVAARIVAKQEFAGYWEYVLDEAIFTAPAHPNWGGTALIGPAGDLLGIGSLQLQHAVEKGQAQNINMIVPIDLLNPILDDLMKFGRRNAPPRPWLGLYATEVENRLVIVGLADQRPGQESRPAHRRHRALGRRQGGARPGRLLPPRLGSRRSRRRRADLDLPRRRHHGRAGEIERAQSVSQGAEFALRNFGYFDEAKIDPTYMGGIECGRRNPSLLVTGRIAKALSVPLAKLLND